MLLTPSKERQLKRALKKCSRFCINEIHAYCTPTEYLLLFIYFSQFTRQDFEIKHWYDWTLKHKREGVSNPGAHYFAVPSEEAEKFPHSKYFIATYRSNE